ncbi:protein of unknown function [Legionella hackeliae]|uniref:Uncharacterized protein n=1 Tax=Legionella hackeliae TaxID=449 RepID=A0A0A8UQ15_LEGHA|nr:protein of unknown function [Legionella hackeliae]
MKEFDVCFVRNISKIRGYFLYDMTTSEIKEEYIIYSIAYKINNCTIVQIIAIGLAVG